jgi:putative transposase
MLRGLVRYYGAGHLQFITCSCYHRQPILGTPQRRDLLLRVLEQVRERYCLVILGYVVMPEHFHLLITEPQKGTPSTVMQALKLGFARRVLAGALPDTSHHVWQRRFYDFNVWTERKRIEKLRYIHRNPVNRGLVEEPHQWQWSSFRSYACGEAGQVSINDWQLLKMKIRPSAA